MSTSEPDAIARAHALIGRRVAGKMEILEYLGGGGMGWVFSAYHHTLKKRVAIKVLKRMGDPLHAKRFEVEAHSASRLQHPNAVTILDFGEDGEDRLVYLAMEFVEGLDLDRIIRNEAPMEPQRAAAIIVQALAGLSSAHEAGVIHRDLKPANIMVTHRTNDDGQIEEFVKVCDFGLAKLTDPGGPGQGLTRRGMIVGTPDYMSPEQAVGDAVDGRTDVYAAGVILYEMLTGRRPFEAKDPGEVLLMHLNDVPKSPRSRVPSIPEDLERIVLWAMEKRSEHRAASARELREALKRFLSQPARASLGSMVDADHLQAVLHRPETLAPESVTDQHEIPVIAISSWDTPPADRRDHSGHDTLIDHPAQSRATPQEIPIPTRGPVPTPDPLPQDRAAPSQDILSSSTWRPEEGLNPDVVFDYQGPHAFYLLDPSPRQFGPCDYFALQNLVLQLVPHGPASEACVSVDGQQWRSLRRYLELTSQVDLLPGEIADGVAGAGPSGRLSETSPCAMFSTIARLRPSGRLLIEADGHRTEISLRDGQPVNVRASHPEEQTPALLRSRELVPAENLPALMHTALSSDTRIEHLLAGAVDVQVLRGALMKERLLGLMPLSHGTFQFDQRGGTPQGTPIASSLLALLPNLVRRTLPIEALDQALAPHYATPLARTADSEALLELMQASPVQREVAAQLGGGNMARSLAGSEENKQLILPLAYILLEIGALTAAV